MDASTAGLALGLIAGAAECVSGNRFNTRHVMYGVGGSFLGLSLLGVSDIAESVVTGFFAWASVRAVAEIVRIIRRGGWGDGNGGGGGGGGGWDPPEDPAPWGPGPTDFKPERVGTVHAVESALTMDDFFRETGGAPAPDPLVPVGRG